MRNSIWNLWIILIILLSPSFKLDIKWVCFSKSISFIFFLSSLPLPRLFTPGLQRNKGLIFLYWSLSLYNQMMALCYFKTMFISLFDICFKCLWTELFQLFTKSAKPFQKDFLLQPSDKLLIGDRDRIFGTGQGAEQLRTVDKLPTTVPFALVVGRQEFEYFSHQDISLYFVSPLQVGFVNCVHESSVVYTYVYLSCVSFLILVALWLVVHQSLHLLVVCRVVVEAQSWNQNRNARQIVTVDNRIKIIEWNSINLNNCSQQRE